MRYYILLLYTKTASSRHLCNKQKRTLACVGASMAVQAVLAAADDGGDQHGVPSLADELPVRRLPRLHPTERDQDDERASEGDESEPAAVLPQRPHLGHALLPRSQQASGETTGSEKLQDARQIVLK